MRDAIFERLDSIEDLPSIPAVIIKLTEAIQDIESSANDVSKIMEEDPAIMTRVLKVVNSAFYSNSFSSNPITNVKHAIVRLGFDTVRNIALTTSIFSIFKEDHAQVFNRKAFWKHSICTGIVANVVYGYSDRENQKIPQESVALAGLLHDIGKIVMEQYFYDLFTKVLSFGQEKGLPIYLIEHEALGTSHSEIGAWLAKKWKLNADLVACIEYHHDPMAAPEEYRDMVGLVHIADYICNLKKLGQSGNVKPPEFNQQVWEHLGLDVSMIDKIMEVVDQEEKKSEILLALT